MKNCWLKSKLLTSFILTTFFLIVIVTTAAAQFNLNVILQSMQAAPVPGEMLYQVDVYTSVQEGSGAPVKDLNKSNFTVKQDSQPVVLDMVESAADIPIQVVLVLDTSGSMAGTPLDQSKEAARNFVAHLGATDQVAVISFNNTVIKETDFTDPTSALATLASISVVPGAGTCLYDAIYAASELAQSLTPGRRAVLVLTDGNDLTPSGSLCSTHTVDDDITKASQGVSRIPIYTIGLGNDISKDTLSRIAGLTGGTALFASTSSELDDLFTRITEQLKYQYHLSYQTQASVGKHTITVQAAIGSNNDVKSADLFFPELPPAITFDTPVDGNQIYGKTAVKISLQGKTDAVKTVRLEADGKEVGSSTIAPYEFSYDASQHPTGKMELDAVVLDGNGVELSRKKIDLVVSDQPVGTQPNSSSAAPGTENFTSFLDQKVAGIPLFALLSAGLLVVIAGIVAAVLSSRGKKQKGTPAAPSQSSNEGMTLDGFVFSVPGGAALATLSVTYSDDPMRIGEQIPLSKFPVTLGRSKDNMVVFEKDQPVSRFHARIDYGNGDFSLSEAVENHPDGSKKYPTYGTFVNEVRLTGNSVPLSPNDEIRLGNRLKLRFNISATGLTQANSSEGMTLDGFATGEVTSEVKP